MASSASSVSGSDARFTGVASTKLQEFLREKTSAVGSNVEGVLRELQARYRCVWELLHTPLPLLFSPQLCHAWNSIKALRHAEHPDLIGFKYQSCAPFKEAIVQEARGEPFSAEHLQLLLINHDPALQASCWTLPTIGALWPALLTSSSMQASHWPQTLTGAQQQRQRNWMDHCASSTMHELLGGWPRQVNESACVLALRHNIACP